MRSLRLLSIGALSAALILPTAVVAQAPSGAEFAATITPKAFVNTLTVPVTVRKTNLPSGTTMVGYVVRAVDTLPASPSWLAQPTTFKLAADSVDGEHTLYVWAKAKPGPVITSTPGEGTTFLDRVKPVTSAVSSSPVEGVITDRAVDITFSYSDPGEPATGSGVSKYAIVNGTTAPALGTVAWKNVPSANGPATVNDHLVTSGNGAKTVSVFVRDRAGNVSTVASLSYTLAVSGPTVTLTAPAFTKALKPGIKAVAKKNGVAITGATYYRVVTDSITPPALPATPNWKVSVTDATMLAQGDNFVHVWAKDSNGSVSSSPATAKIVYDTTNPVGVLNLENGTTTDRSVSVAPTADDGSGSGVTHWAILNGTTAPAGWTPIATAFPSTWTLTLGDGTKTVTLWLKDAAGNISSASETIEMALAGPSVTVIITATDAYKNGSNQWFTKNLPVGIKTTWVDNAGIGKDNAGYKANLTGTTPTTWSLGAATSINLADQGDGSQTIHSFVKDKNGSIGSNTVSIYLDRTAPVFTTLSTPANTNNRDIVLTIAGNDGSGSGIDAWATVLGTTQPAPSSSTWLASPDTTVTLADSDGNQTVTVFVRDELGQVRSSAVVVKLDRVNPSSTLSVVSPGKTRDADVTVGGADAGGSGITAYAVVEGTSAPASNSPSWVASAPDTFQVTAGDGSKTISAFTRDAAGNVSSADTETFVLDTTVPTVTFTAPSSTATELISITVGGADVGGTGVAKYVVVEGTTAPALNDPSWTVAAPTEFTVSSGAGDKTLNAFTVDNAGNVSDPVEQTVTLN